MSHTNTIAKRKLRSSYITTTVSISLVLFILGIIGFLGLNTQRLSKYVKENIGLTIYLNDDVKPADLNKLKKLLDAKPYVKSTELITKEDAAKILKDELGEDFISFLGMNPLSASINLYFYSDYAQTDSLEAIQKNLAQYPQVKEIVYQKDLLTLIENNVNKINFILSVFGILLFITSYTLINNTIRLSIYSQRFVIRTMKLVGASKSFIRQPFLTTSLIIGLASSLIAIGILYALLFLLRNDFAGLFFYNQAEFYGILIIGLIVSGMVISYLATFFAVSKYLKIKEQELYY